MTLPLSPPEYPESPWCFDCDEPHEKVALIVEGQSECIPLFLVKTLDFCFSPKKPFTRDSELPQGYYFLVAGVEVPNCFYYSISDTSEWKTIRDGVFHPGSEESYSCWVEICNRFKFLHSSEEAVYFYTLCAEKKPCGMTALYFARRIYYEGGVV